MAVEDWEAEAPEPDDALQLADVIAALANAGEAFPTGFAPIDRVLRGGGLIPGKMLAIIGPPGAGKTILSCMILKHMSAWLPSIALFADEGREEAAIKLGQQLGYDRETLEKGAPKLLSSIRARLEDTFILPDPEAPGASIKKCVERLHLFGQNGAAPHKLLALDSIQTIRLTPQQDDSPDSRESITAAAYAMRRVLKLNKWLGLVTAQANRDAYKSKKVSDNTHPLAAAAGARALEYAADICVVFGIPNDDDVGKVWITKNRLGKKGVFYVKLDRERANLIEVDSSVMEESEQREAAETIIKRIEKAKAPVLAELCKTPGLTTAQIADGIGARKADVTRALAMLEEDGKVRSTRVGKTNKKVYDAT